MRSSGLQRFDTRDSSSFVPSISSSQNQFFSTKSTRRYRNRRNSSIRHQLRQTRLSGLGGMTLGNNQSGRVHRIHRRTCPDCDRETRVRISAEPVFLFCPVFPVLLGMKEKGVLSADDYTDLEKHCAFLQGWMNSRRVFRRWLKVTDSSIRGGNECFHEVSDKTEGSLHFTSLCLLPLLIIHQRQKTKIFGGYNLLILHLLHQSVLWSSWFKDALQQSACEGTPTVCPYRLRERNPRSNRGGAILLFAHCIQ